MTAHQANRPPKGVGAECVALHSPSSSSYHTDLQNFTSRVLAVCTQLAAQNLRSPPKQTGIPTQKFLSCHSETRSQTSKPLKLIISAYPERVLMRILPAKTDLRNQHYFGCQIFPLEILTSKSYHRKRYENTRLFSKNPDRPHSRLLPSSLVRLS